MVKTYDFKSPKKFTKERMSTVENLYDTFSRSLATYLTGLLQVYCEMHITRIVEKRYQEYSSQIEDRSLFGLVTLMPENKECNEAPLVMELDTALGFFMIERLLGGAGTEYQLHRDFTDIEKAVLEYLLGRFSDFIGDAWQGYMGVEAHLTGLQTNPHLLQMSAPEDVVILVELEVLLNDLSANIHIVMPAPNVEELTSKFGYKYAMNNLKQDDFKIRMRQQFIKQHLLESEVELRAILNTFALDAQEVMDLQVGDVIPIGKHLDTDIEIFVEDMACFEAKLGHTKLNKAVSISKVL
ncbi:flagellar motor switch protein FliM [Diplocloster hominis]|uniref:flagellar motor switch protein FliM n=1 Tax=Diplocloster hominis TaxID=3079010 RepID=UPI0031BAE144